MYNTSSEYRGAIGAPIRRNVGRVTFDITDVTAYDDVSSITTSGEALYSQKAQVVDRKRRTGYRLATLEPNRFALDGSFSFPDNNLVNNGETGYVSDVLCGADGTFAVYPVITINLTGSHSSAGLTITFDTDLGEYATAYDIAAYDASNALITSVSITNNTDVIDEPLAQLLGYRKIVIMLKKWSVPYRRARVLEVDFGIVRVYRGDNLISFGLIEEMDLSSGMLPSAEFDFSVDNHDRAFNILNPTGFYKYLQQRQKIYGEIGLELPSGAIEYIPLGEYFLSEWTSDEGSMVASFRARTALDLMAGYPYEQLTVVTQSLATLAESIFLICGIRKYELDASLNSITTNSLVKDASCRDVLQMIAIAGCCNVMVTRDGVIKVFRPASGAAIDDVTFDNMYNEPQVTLERITKQVDVSYWTADLENAAGVSSAIAPGVTDGEMLTVSGNTLISTAARATAVASWILQQRQYRAKFAVNWRGNQAHEVADCISLQTSYGIDQVALITKHDLSYRGYLQVRTEAKGVPS